jgi:hypothetical protein
VALEVFLGLYSASCGELLFAQLYQTNVKACVLR